MSGLWNSSLRLLLQSFTVIGSRRQLVSPIYTIQPVVKPVVKPVWQKVASCIQPVVKLVVQPGFTSGWTNSCCSFNTVVKPVSQPVVSCKQGFSIIFYKKCTANVTTLPCYVWQRSGSCHDISVGVGTSQRPVMWCGLEVKSTATAKTVPEMTYNVFSGTLNPTHFTSAATECGWFGDVVCLHAAPPVELPVVASNGRPCKDTRYRRLTRARTSNLYHRLVSGKFCDVARLLQHSQ